MKFSKLLAFLTLAAGLVTMIGPWTFAQPCVEMNGVAICLTTRLYALGAGAIMVLLSIILFKVRGYVAAKILSLLVAVVGVLTILVPTIFAPVCTQKGMHCRTTMLPFLMLVGAVVALIGIIFLLKGARKPEPEKPAVVPAAPAAPETPAPAPAPAAEAPETETSFEIPEEIPQPELKIEEPLAGAEENPQKSTPFLDE